MKKKVFALVMAMVMVVGCLAGCGGGNDDGGASEGGESSGAAVVKIGGIGPLTGAAATYGIATKNGAQIAVDEINALGGVQFELNFQDDEADGEKGVNAYNNLKDWGMHVLYGCTTTGSCVAVSGETYADRYFQLTPSASSTDVTAGKDNVFQVCFTDPNQGVTAADFVKDLGNVSKVGVLYNNGDAYSAGIAVAFVAHAKEIGLEIVAETTFPDDSNTDFSAQLNECKANGAEMVFMPIYYTPASLVLAQAKSMGYAPVFFGGDGMDGILGMEGFDATLAEGLMLMTPFNASATDERTQKFVETYTNKYGTETLNQFAADGYDCIYAIYEAWQAAGCSTDMSAQDICEAMVAQFTSSSFSVDGLTGSGMTWGTNGEVSKAPMVVRVESGAYVTVE
ncbi:MAG: ABC transporter substrate-binding protein [Oscillospiraceae bacterium]|nr:ABC transporter substrate-binding protein [Oscillospiraceae bacterium]